MSDSMRSRTTCEHCGLGTRIVTPCPTCGGQTLFVGTGGHLTCSFIGCREPVVARAVDQVKARCNQLDDLLLWALGEVGEDFPAVPPDWPKRKFYWRTALRTRHEALARAFAAD